MKLPSLTRRNEPAPAHDGVDGPNGGATTVATGEPVATDRDHEHTTYRSGATATDGERTADAERRAAERAAVARSATVVRPTGEEARRAGIDATDAEERTVDLDRDRTARRPVDPVDGEPRPAPEPPVAIGPKPRASLLATLGLVVGVAGALFVLTGTLAGYGIAVGALGAVLSVLGLVATRRRHVAGKTDALLGMAFGVAAVVLGVLAMTGQFDWPTTDGDWVQRLREWLDSQFAGLV
ncbi:thrombospondin [Micromonospora sp. B11E3]|uniref:thrombospondin n=1 Tax=Micromonospora sp. B11E3 TaxID=3153562 RepID=UPI00325D6D1F